MRIFPVLCASALHNVGSDLILNFIVDNLPAPTEREGIAATVNGARRPRRKSPAPASLRPSSSRPRPTRSPGASPISR